MTKSLVYTFLDNRTERKTHNGNVLITVKRKDVTENAINLVFSYMNTHLQINKKPKEKYEISYKIEVLGIFNFKKEEEKEGNL